MFWVVISSFMVAVGSYYFSSETVYTEVLNLDNVSAWLLVFQFLYCKLNLNSVRRNPQSRSLHDGSVIIIKEPSPAWSVYTTNISNRR